jgi:branched-chain amino acid transport system ATP-binding protein
LSFLMEIADAVYVLDHGRVIAFGPPDEIAADPEVKRIYLGEQEGDQT